MVLFISGLVIFMGVHAIPMHTDVRTRLVLRLGEKGYAFAFSLASLIGFVLIVSGYGELQTAGSGNPVIWVPPTWTRHVTFLLMIPATILLAAAYIPSRIRDAVRHPMLAAIKIWALAHLMTNGDLASLMLFGSFLAFAVVDRISVKRRAARGPLGERTGTLAGDLSAVGVGLVVYALLLFFGHGWLIGVPLIAG
ncbi:MAG: NnrU family protein [Hyphomicrobiaceae bacterium]